MQSAAAPENRSMDYFDKKLHGAIEHQQSVLQQPVMTAVYHIKSGLQ
jgi:hypothetical protein